MDHGHIVLNQVLQDLHNLEICNGQASNLDNSMWTIFLKSKALMHTGKSTPTNLHLPLLDLQAVVPSSDMTSPVWQTARQITQHRLNRVAFGRLPI